LTSVATVVECQKRTLAELLDHLVGGSARVQTKPHFT